MKPPVYLATPTMCARPIGPSDLVTPDGGASWSKTYAQAHGKHSDRSVSWKVAAEGERDRCLAVVERSARGAAETVWVRVTVPNTRRQVLVKASAPRAGTDNTLRAITTMALAEYAEGEREMKAELAKIEAEVIAEMEPEKSFPVVGRLRRMVYVRIGQAK